MSCVQLLRKGLNKDRECRLGIHLKNIDLALSIFQHISSLLGEQMPTLYCTIACTLSKGPTLEEIVAHCMAWAVFEHRVVSLELFKEGSRVAVGFEDCSLEL
jgi:hypothetical protein